MLRGQSALEYLLLIGGAVLVSTVILLLALGTAPVGNLFLSNQLGQYGQIGNSIPSPPITGPPIISSFNLSPDSTPASLRADISLANVGPGTTIRFLAWNTILTPSPLSIANFSTLSTNDWAHQLTLPANQSSTYQFFLNEILPQANHSYDAALLVCNSPNLMDCALAQTTGTSGAPSNGPASSSGNITIAFGSPEVVWDTTVNPSNPGQLILYNAGGTACNPGDIPDMPAHPVVTATGELLVYRGNSWENRLLRGTNFSNLTTDCTDPIPYDSHVPATFFTSTPDTYRDREWIGSFYRDPADTSGVIHAIIHNEYHDPRSSSDPPCREGFASPANQCNYFSITHAISTDNGFTFTPSSPNNVVAASHLDWDPFVSLPPGFTYPSYGIMMNSNILKRGSYYYLFVHAVNDSFPSHLTRGICVGRTTNLNDPSSWRFWDGTSYSIRQGSPYAIPSEAPTTPCAFVGKNQIDQMAMNIVYSTYLKKYLVISPSNTPGSGAPCGAFFATSDDLITWSPRQLMYPMLQSTGPCAAPNPPYEVYSTLIDHAQLGEALANIDPNFEKVGKTPHLYFVRWHAGLHRDLERVPITFCDRTQEACP